MKTEIDVEPKTLRDPNATPNIVEINGIKLPINTNEGFCLLYTSDAADECVNV